MIPALFPVRVYRPAQKKIKEMNTEKVAILSFLAILGSRTTTNIGRINGSAVMAKMEKRGRMIEPIFLFWIDSKAYMQRKRKHKPRTLR